jgi:hypothetical protein
MIKSQREWTFSVWNFFGGGVWLSIGPQHMLAGASTAELYPSPLSFIICLMEWKENIFGNLRKYKRHMLFLLLYKGTKSEETLATFTVL